MKLNTAKYDQYVNINTIPAISEYLANEVKIKNDHKLFSKILSFISLKDMSMHIETDEGDTLTVFHIDNNKNRIYIEKDTYGVISLYNRDCDLVVSFADNYISTTDIAYDFFKELGVSLKEYTHHFNFKVAKYPTKDTRGTSQTNTLRYASQTNENVIFVYLQNKSKFAVIKNTAVLYDVYNGVITNDSSEYTVTYKTGISCNDAINQVKPYITEFINAVRSMCEVGNADEFINNYDDTKVNSMSAGDALRNVMFKENIAETVDWLRYKSRNDNRYAQYVYLHLRNGHGTLATARKHMIYALCTIDALCDVSDQLRYMDTLSESLTKALSE